MDSFGIGEARDAKLFGDQGADSLTMSGSAQDAYCYGYQSCLDIVFAQSTVDNDAEAYGYQSMYNAIDNGFNAKQFHLKCDAVDEKFKEKLIKFFKKINCLFFSDITQRRINVVL